MAMTYKDFIANTPTKENESKKYTTIQNTLLEAGSLIFKASQMLEDIKEAALNKPNED